MFRLILVDRLEKSVLVNIHTWQGNITKAYKPILIIEEMVIVLYFNEEIANIEQIFVANPGHFNFDVHLQLSISI